MVESKNVIWFLIGQYLVKNESISGPRQDRESEKLMKFGTWQRIVVSLVILFVMVMLTILGSYLEDRSRAVEKPMGYVVGEDPGRKFVEATLASTKEGVINDTALGVGHQAARNLLGSNYHTEYSTVQGSLRSGYFIRMTCTAAKPVTGARIGDNHEPR